MFTTFQSLLSHVTVDGGEKEVQFGGEKGASRVVTQWIFAQAVRSSRL
jgi:hypothetical protein